MSLADESQRNCEPTEEKYYFKEISSIIRTIKECAKANSADSHNLSGYYSYCGNKEGDGIYADITDRDYAEYYHPEDFGEYAEGIYSYGWLKNEEIVSVENVKRALKEIKDTLVKDGFKNVVVEERKIGENYVKYSERGMSFNDLRVVIENGYPRNNGKKNVYVAMPVYNLYISIDW